MGTCKVLVGNNKICGQQSQDYFWFHDSHELINEVYHICHNHSQSLLIEQMLKENQLRALIEALGKQRDNLYKQKNSTDRIVHQPGMPEISISSKDKIDRELRIIKEKINFQWELLKKERNKTCRWCGHLLTEPEFDIDHVKGNPFSHSDWHSQWGYRREVMMYHTACGREFMSQKIRLTVKQLSFIKPRDTGQTTLRELLET